MIHDVFHMSLLEQNTTRKRRVDLNNIAELDANNNKDDKYEIETIWDSAVFMKESKLVCLLKLYYLVF